MNADSGTADTLLLGLYLSIPLFIVPAISLYRSATALTTAARIAYAIVSPILFIACIVLGFHYLPSAAPSEFLPAPGVMAGVVSGVFSVSVWYRFLNSRWRRENTGRQVSLKDLMMPAAVFGAIILAVVLFSMFFHGVLGRSYPAAIALGLVSAIVSFFFLFWLWTWLFIGRRSMSYSMEGDAAMQRFVDDLRAGLAASNESIVSVGRLWMYGYPKVGILFTSDDACRQARATDLINQIADKLGEFVRNDSAFGRNRNSFDGQRAIMVTANRQVWSVFIQTAPS